MDSVEEISSTLRESLLNLERKEEDFISLGKRMLSNQNQYLFDLFCTAALNRSLNLVRGFILLMNDKNFISAAPLVRVHLDTLLRLYAFSLIDQNIDEVTLKIMTEGSMRKLRSRDGCYLRDDYLVNSISHHEQFKWVKPLYKILSGFVHLSELHILASSKIIPKNSILKGGITRTDEFVPEDDKLASITLMIRISDGIVTLIDEWIEQKETYKKNNLI